MQQSPTLPLDVWLCIMDNIEGRTLFTLTETCREFHRVALAKAYNTIVFKAPGDPSLASTLTSEMDGLASALEDLQGLMDRVLKLQQNTAHLRYIRHIRLLSWGIFSGEVAYAQSIADGDDEMISEAKEIFDDAYEQVLIFVRRLALQSLFLGCCIITPGLLDVIYGVSTLRTVHIQDYISPCRLWKNTISGRYPATHHVTELRLNTICTDGSEGDDIKTYLLLLLGSSLKVLEIPIQAISNVNKKLFPEPFFEQLEDLLLLDNIGHPMNAASLGWLLRSSPKLHRLTMDAIPLKWDYLTHMDTMMNIDDPSQAPKTYKSDEEMFASILPGFTEETLHKLEFIDAPFAFTHTILSSFRLTSLQEVVVEVPGLDREQKLTEFCQYLSATLPGMAKLKMKRGRHRDDSIKFEYVSIISNHLPNVIQLHLTGLEEIEGDVDSVELLRALLEGLCVFPSLQICTIESLQSNILNTSIGLTSRERIHEKMKFICFPGDVLWAWIDHRGWCIVDWTTTIRELSVWSYSGKGFHRLQDVDYF
ncbi:hypothetical protein M422DRAFT_781090 [Sphaerobolus stellatus SS14]|uniref:F-box domain-containing protein n=1 Tax=Sphaerobolus stellatus (strain SS14) TaxID=990650 RepID=A0A0C9UWL5_SPHS4|nr:hypothetical protein M422DRAFT_781090 [Sphaerobolus stellatus SS14]